MFILFVAMMVLFILSLLHIVPWTERLLSFVWEDRSIAYAAKARERVEALMVDGNTSPEMAKMLAATELGVEERQLQDMVNSITLKELSAMARRGVSLGRAFKRRR